MKPSKSMSADLVCRDNDDNEEAWDDVSGAKLDIDKVKVARKEEMDQYWKHEVYTKVSEDECWKKLEKRP